MSIHLVARNNPDLPGSPQVLCLDKEKRVAYWADLKISREIGHKLAIRFNSHENAWRGADVHGGIAICEPAEKVASVTTQPIAVVMWAHTPVQGVVV